MRRNADQADTVTNPKSAMVPHVLTEDLMGKGLAFMLQAGSRCPLHPPEEWRGDDAPSGSQVGGGARAADSLSNANNL